MFKWLSGSIKKLMKGIKSPQARQAVETTLKVVLALTDEAKPFCRVISMVTAGTPVPFDDIAWQWIRSASNKRRYDLETIAKSEDRDERKSKITSIVVDAMIAQLEQRAAGSRFEIGGIRIAVPGDIAKRIPRRILEQAVGQAYVLFENPIPVEPK